MKEEEMLGIADLLKAGTPATVQTRVRIVTDELSRFFGGRKDMEIYARAGIRSCGVLSHANTVAQ